MVLIFQTTAHAQDIHGRIAEAIGRLSNKTPNELLEEKGEHGYRLNPEQNKSKREIVQNFYNVLRQFKDIALLENYLKVLKGFQAEKPGEPGLAGDWLMQFGDGSKLTRAGAKSLLDFLVAIEDSRAKWEGKRKGGFMPGQSAPSPSQLERAGNFMSRRIDYGNIAGARLSVLPEMVAEAAGQLETGKMDGYFSIYFGDGFSKDCLDIAKFRNFLTVAKTGQYYGEMNKIALDSELLSDAAAMEQFFKGVQAMEARLEKEAGFFGWPVALINRFIRNLPPGLAPQERLKGVGNEVEKFIQENPIAMFRQEQKEMKGLEGKYEEKTIPVAQMPEGNLDKVEVVWQGQAAIFDKSSSQELLYTFNAVNCSALVVIVRDGSGEVSKVCLAHVDPGMRDEEVGRLFAEMQQYGKLDVYIFGGILEATQKIYKHAKKAGANISMRKDKIEYDNMAPDAISVDKAGKIYDGNIPKYNDMEKANMINETERDSKWSDVDQTIHIRYVK
ncbi:MAG: hypothetical protein NTX79_07415 [Candidatus Micrarchaeota archaeon]|nr:hypothetical protein [Candidatus Micrarchaeota archaeon]